MITLQRNGCKVDILPVVNGLTSEGDRVRSCMTEHESYAMALGVDGIMALRNRASIEEEYEVSELDIVYAKHMEAFGTIEMPSPAMCAFVDWCTERGEQIVALDYNDEDYTELYCNTVKATDFVREHRLAKKGLKKRFDCTTPEDLALAWDEHVNSVKGYKRMSELREEHLASEISKLMEFKHDALVCIEVERIKNVVAILESAYDMSRV